MNKSIILYGILAIVILTGFIGFSSFILASNSEIQMVAAVEEQQEVCASYYDKMWKIISQKAQVSNEYKEGFNEIYTNIMNGRYSNGGGELMSWIQEANPNFDSSLYKDIMRSIEVERNNYLIQERKLISLDKEHDLFIKIFPNNIFIGSRPQTEIHLIRSTKTNKSFETGIDDNIIVFD